MKKLLPLIGLVLLQTSTFLGQEDYEDRDVRILRTSTLNIKGDTNVNQFQCVFNTVHLDQKHKITYRKNGREIHFKNTSLFLENEAFNCGHKAINRDFNLLLKTSEYPRISLELRKVVFDNENRATALIRIKIAGKEKDYSLPVKVSTSPIDRFTGSMKLNIRDFGLEPPKKVLGLIVLKEEIQINLDLIAQI